jgi:hypothetical protein
MVPQPFEVESPAQATPKPPPDSEPPNLNPHPRDLIASAIAKVASLCCVRGLVPTMGYSPGSERPRQQRQGIEDSQVSQNCATSGYLGLKCVCARKASHRG